MLKNRGFSLIEVLIVVAMAAIIFLISTPISLKLYRTQLVEEARSNIVDALRRAKHNAVLQKNDSNFGVYFDQVAHEYVIFQTPDLTYESRVADQDEVFPLIDQITLTGATEIIFSKLTGLPNAVGTSTITYDSVTGDVIVGEVGDIYKSVIVVSTSTPVVIEPTIPTDGLIAYWPFDGNANDAVGDHDGSVTGASLTTGIDNVDSTAYYFDSTDKIDVGDVTFLDGKSTMSVSMWLYTTSRDGTFISKGIAHGNGVWLYYFDYAGANTIQFRYYANSGTASSNYGEWYFSVSDYFTLNNWYNVTFTVDLATETPHAYVNGTEILTVLKREYGTGIPSSIANITGTMSIGARPNSGHPFNGKIDEVRIYDRVLTEDEVGTLYEVGAP